MKVEISNIKDFLNETDDNHSINLVALLVLKRMEILN